MQSESGRLRRNSQTLVFFIPFMHVILGRKESWGVGRDSVNLKVLLGPDHYKGHG